MACKGQTDSAPATSDALQIEWQFTFGEEEPATMVGVAGDAVANTVTGASGVLVSNGSGQQPGQGTCHQYWVVLREVAGCMSEHEVLEGTPQAMRRVRGSAGELLIRLASGAELWCTAHHVRIIGHAGAAAGAADSAGSVAAEGATREGSGEAAQSSFGGGFGGFGGFSELSGFEEQEVARQEREAGRTRGNKSRSNRKRARGE